MQRRWMWVGLLAAELLSGLSTSALALKQQSFRMEMLSGGGTTGGLADLAGIVEDDYTDLMLFPVTASDLRGGRLYTNLSNLTSGTHQPLAPGASYNDSPYLVGVVTPPVVAGLRGAAMYEDASATTPDRINTGDLRGAVDLEVADGWPNHLDPGNRARWEWSLTDTTSRLRESGSGSASTSTSHRSLGAVLATRFGGFPIGAGLYYRSRLDDSQRSSYTTSTYTATRDLDTANPNTKVGTWSVTSKDNSGLQPSSLSAVASTALSVGPVSLRVGGSIARLSGDSSRETVTKVDLTQGYQADPSGGGGAGPSATGPYKRTHTHKVTAPWSGLGLGLQLQARYPLTDTTTLAAFGLVRSESSRGDWKEETINHIENDGRGGGTKTTGSSTTAVSGNLLQLQGAVGTEVRFDRLLLGLGVRLDRTVTQTATQGSRTRTQVDNNPPTFTPTAIDTQNTNTTTTVALPVGLEWTPLEWLQVRVGATHHIEYTEQLTTTTTHSYSDTTETATETGTSALTAGSGSTGRSTRYQAGVGLDLTENLHVDVRRIMQVDSPSEWEVSATLRF